MPLELDEPEELPMFGQGWLVEEEPPDPEFAPGVAFEGGVVVPDPLDVDPLDVEPLDVEPLDVEPLDVEPLDVEPLDPVDAVVEMDEGVVVDVLLVVALASAELSPKLKPNAPAAIPATKSGLFM